MDVSTLVVIAAHKSGGYSQLSSEIGVGRTTIWRWKNNELKPSKMAIKCLCDLTKGVVSFDMVKEEDGK